MWLAESRVNGTGRAVIIQEDFRRARDLFTRAARRGLATAFYNLGSMSLLGQGSSPDSIGSYTWFSLARDRASDEATRAQALRNLGLLAAKMSKEQIQDALRRARDWPEADPMH